MTTDSTLAGVQERFRRDLIPEVLAWMGRRRMSQRQLARQLGVSHAWMSRRMTGEVAFNTDELIALAAVLGCDVADFLPEHEYHQRPIPTSLRERFRYDERAAGATHR